MTFTPTPRRLLPRRAGGRLAAAAALVAGVLVCAILVAAAQETPSTAEPLHRPFDQLLDLYVRDGLVYYGALKADRGKLDRYVASLAAQQVGEWPRERQVAFWLNAYDAFVLQTVVSNYPIHGRAAAYPPNSVRQIPGAFDRLAHRAAGRSVTLDAIEKEILPAFHDPRVFLALGRGALGSGRLRSEAFSGDRLEQQLREVAAETVTRPELWRVDPMQNRVAVSSIFSWHAPEFIAAYGSEPGPFASRSPIERAVLAFVAPFLLPTERDYLAENHFQMAFIDFDWRLNDLGNRGR